jgi:uncharacterized membrane protein YfcA
MPDAKTTLLICLGIVGFGFVAFWGSRIVRARNAARASGERIGPTPYELFVGFVTDFLDTIGIGSFATTTAFYRARRTIDDRHLPGTLNVGHTLPTITQAFLFIGAVQVEMKTLILMIAAAVLGALLGAPIVCRWPRRKIQIGMGLALLVVGAVMAYRQIANPQGGTAIGLEGTTLALGIAGNFVLGALMTIGIGLYGPCLVLVSMLGMNVGTAFPIMMGACAFLMPLASVPFVRNECYAPRAAIGLTLAGVPAVLIAFYLFNKLLKHDPDLRWVKWLVLVVIVYTSIQMLRAAARGDDRPPAKSAGAPQSVV